MSRILRRPMFRGGQVIDSRGTGITSGLMDGGRVGYNQGELVTGRSLVDKAKSLFLGPYFNDPNFKPKSIPYVKGSGFKFMSPENQFPEEYTEDLLDKEQGETIDELGFKKQPPIRYNKGEEKEMKQQDLEVGEGDLNLTEEDKKGLNEFYKSLDIKEKVGDYKGGVPDKTTVVPQINTDAITGNQEQTTEIDPKELMRENAELFKELLGEGNKKKLKDARISDVSDYLLKFFEGSQREGATVGSSAAEVAAFATSKPSKTEQAKAAIEKQDQTAVALSINDYIAGKRSKEQVEAMIAKSDLALSNKKAAIDYANKLTQGFSALPSAIADAKKSNVGYVGAVVDGLRKTGLSQFPIEKVTSKEMEEQFEFDPETDTGKIFIETDTKTTYTFRSDGTKRIIDQG